MSDETLSLDRASAGRGSRRFPILNPNTPFDLDWAAARPHLVHCSWRFARVWWIGSEFEYRAPRTHRVAQHAWRRRGPAQLHPLCLGTLRHYRQV